MYNSNWDKNKDVIKNLQLYRINNIVNYLHEMRDFIIMTPGKLSENRIPVLKPDYISSKDARFPENAIFLCEGYGEWCQYYHALLLCTSTMINHNRLVREYTNYSTAGEAEEFALELIAKILETIYDNLYFVNRTVFEDRYSLEWCITESPQPRHQAKKPIDEIMERVKLSSDKKNEELIQQKENNDVENKDNEEPSP